MAIKPPLCNKITAASTAEAVAPGNASCGEQPLKSPKYAARKAHYRAEAIPFRTLPNMFALSVPEIGVRFHCWGEQPQGVLPVFKTLLLSAAFVGASVIGAAAQSTTTPSASGSANVSAATHCKDKTTGQARLKTAANTGSATSGNTTGAASGSSTAPKSSSPAPSSSSGSSGMSGSTGSTGSSGPTVAAANLPDCQ